MSNYIERLKKLEQAMADKGLFHAKASLSFNYVGNAAYLDACGYTKKDYHYRDRVSFNQDAPDDTPEAIDKMFADAEAKIAALENLNEVRRVQLIKRVADLEREAAEIGVEVESRYFSDLCKALSKNVLEDKR